jgi:outer membrane protein OmpU
MEAVRASGALRFAMAASVAIAAPFATHAAENSGNLADLLALEPPQWMFGNYEMTLGGLAGGALFRSSQEPGPAFPNGYDVTRGSGELSSNIRVQRTLDNGMVLGARSDLLLYHDRLSGDIYDNDTVEKLYLFAQTGFGRIEVGQQDGAAYTLALTGPAIDRQMTLDSRRISLFRNPLTGRDFGQFFKQVTAAQSTSNYAKLNYISPRLFGIQIGASFTPETVRTPLPWTGNPENAPNQQHNIWEIAAGYTGYILSNFAVGVSAGFAQGSLTHATNSGADLYDWSVATQLAYTVSETKISFGAAYRGTDAYLLDVREVLQGSKTAAAHFSATLERGSWRLGVENSNAAVSGPIDYRITGYETALGYKLNRNLELSGGWQWYDYARNLGAFYNGRPAIRMNAGFLAFAYAL